MNKGEKRVFKFVVIMLLSIIVSAFFLMKWVKTDDVSKRSPSHDTWVGAGIFAFTITLYSITWTIEEKNKSPISRETEMWIKSLPKRPRESDVSKFIKIMTREALTAKMIERAYKDRSVLTMLSIYDKVKDSGDKHYSLGPSGGGDYTNWEEMIITYLSFVVFLVIFLLTEVFLYNKHKFTFFTKGGVGGLTIYFLGFSIIPLILKWFAARDD